MEQFCYYLLENYIDADSTFPSPVWSICSAPSHKTTKACESFHAHFNALSYSAHPNIFVLVSALQKIQNETYIHMRCVTTRRLTKSASVKKGTSSPEKLNYIGLTLFRKSNFFHQCHKFLPNTHSYFLMVCIYDATCHC